LTRRKRSRRASPDLAYGGQSSLVSGPYRRCVQPYRLFRYRLFDVDGEDIGEINLANPLATGDDFVAGGGRVLRVVALSPASDRNSPFNAMLLVEPAPRGLST